MARTSTAGRDPTSRTLAGPARKLRLEGRERHRAGGGRFPAGDRGEGTRAVVPSILQRDLGACEFGSGVSAGQLAGRSDRRPVGRRAGGGGQRERRPGAGRYLAGGRRGRARPEGVRRGDREGVGGPCGQPGDLAMGSPCRGTGTARRAVHRVASDRRAAGPGGVHDTVTDVAPAALADGRPGAAGGAPR